MDPINIVVALNLVATFGANVSGAKKGLKEKVTVHKEKPESYLQKLPLLLSAASIIALVLGIFQIGTLTYLPEYDSSRLTGLICYIAFSWMQVWAYKSLGESYSQDVLILRNHKLVTNGPFKSIRHPQYLAQILMDIAAGLATLSYIVIIVAIIEIPFLILRAILEERLLAKYFKEQFTDYKKRSGFMFPFIG